MARELRIISLPDGRDLAWLEIGSAQDPPVLCLHGSPGNGREFTKYEAAFAGYRLIAPDRPGYGHSTYDPRRSFAGWTDDVACLADHLGLEEFAVMGVSSGGPNAAACARFLADRLMGCAIVSGPAPPDQAISDDGMLTVNRVERALLRIAPGVALRFIAPLATVALRAGNRHPERGITYLQRTLPPPDSAIVSRTEIRAALLRDFGRPMSATAGRAAVQDFALEVNDWGFRLEDIAMHVHVWHGDQDRNVPIINGLRQADAIPDSTLHRLPDAGHLLIYEHLGEILGQLVP